jgi:ubiquinol-cytochrome c reductase cytochrome b subunit
MSLTFYVLLLIGGGNDIIASIFNLSINQITWTLRIALLVLPPIVYVATKRICIGLQRSDEELLHHGLESGTIRRLPSGEFVEETVPLPVPHRIALTQYAPSEIASGALEHGAAAHDGQTHVVEDELPRPKGFLRPRRARAAVEGRRESTELEGSGQQ